MSSDNEERLNELLDDITKLNYEAAFDRSDELFVKTIKYFRFCPICGNDEIDINVGEGGKDTINCYGCGAKWHIYFGFFDKQLKWAKLTSATKDGEGSEYLGKKIEPINWKEMAIKSHKVLKINTDEE
jgi:hypothetical protein